MSCRPFAHPSTVGRPGATTPFGKFRSVRFRSTCRFTQGFKFNFGDPVVRCRSVPPAKSATTRTITARFSGVCRWSVQCDETGAAASLSHRVVIES